MSTNEKIIIGLSMVKNEEDIIEQFVRHNLFFIDYLCLLENGSVDNTKKILLQLQEEGIPIVIFDDPIPGYFQADKMTKLLKAVSSTFFPDFIIPLDADEFIKCRSKDEFIEALEDIPPLGIGLVKWQTYINKPHFLDKIHKDSLFNMKFRRKNENPQYYKAILRLDKQYSASIRFTQGNHNAYLKVSKNKLPSVKIENILLSHFPVRSVKQITEKAITGWMAYLLKNPNAKNEGSGYQWFNLFQKIKTPGGISRRDLFELSVNYAQDNFSGGRKNYIKDRMKFNYSSKYSRQKKSDTISIIARTLENNLATIDNKILNEIHNLLSGKKTNDTENRNEKKDKSGIFEDEWHLKNLFLDLPPMEFIWNYFKPKNVLDVGCGSGGYIWYLQYLGCKEVSGISEKSLIIPENKYIKHDLAQSFDLEKKYDLVICLEVAEHLSENAALKLIKDIDKHSKRIIVFSAAEINQPGKDHINCKKIDYWIDLWNNLGWETDDFATMQFRALSTFSWLRRNPLILIKSNGNKHTSHRLKEIGSKNYSWWSQKPKIILHPLLEELADDLFDDYNSIMEE